MVEWNSSTKLGANDLFVPSASTHPPPVRLRAGSAVQLAPPTKSIVEVRCLWKHFLCKKLLQEKCCKRKGLQLKACCIITIQSTPQHATCHFHGDPDAKIQWEVHICRDCMVVTSFNGTGWLAHDTSSSTSSKETSSMTSTASGSKVSACAWRRDDYD